MTRDMVLNELPGKSIESICGAALLSCSRGATPMHWSHADVHARKMLCQQHRTTRTAPLIDVAAGDFLGFAHELRRSSHVQFLRVHPCIQHLSIYYIMHSFTTVRPVLRFFPIQSNSLRSVAVRAFSIVL